MQVNGLNNNAYNQNFKGIFKLNDKRIFCKVDGGDFYISKCCAKFARSMDEVLPEGEALLIISPEKPVYAICSEIFDLPVLDKLKELGIKNIYKKLQSPEQILDTSIENYEGIFNKLPDGSIFEFLN